MNAPNQSIVSACGFIAVSTTGVTWGGKFLPFRQPPSEGFDRDALARFLRKNRGSIKRIEQRTPVLVAGRETPNQRVLRYRVDAVVKFLADQESRVDLPAAIELGFPLAALAPDMFGCLARDHKAVRGARTALAPVPADVVGKVQAAWETWHIVNHPAAIPAVPVPSIALEPAKACALAALTEGTLSRAKLAQWATVAGAHSASQLEFLVADVARCLRDRLKTREGQLLFALLLLPTKASSPGQN